MNCKTLLLVASTALLSWSPLAQAERLGDWWIDTKGEAVLYAVSVNDSGHAFGQFCYPGQRSCSWMVGMKTACEKGAKYPVLANSDSGATHLEISCFGALEGGAYGYAFANFDQVDTLVRGSKRVGFALPLQQDQFLVVRFDVREAAAALSIMRRAAEAKMDGPAVRGTSDQKM